MSDLTIGQPAPAFSVATDNAGIVTNQTFDNQPYVIYFYPKDDTPGCTKEAVGFTELMTHFEALNTKILGISKDTTAKHEKFRAKYNLSILLGADESGAVCEAFGVWKEKSMYGKKYMGIERTTVLIGADGRIAHVWPNVKVKGHVEAVLEHAKRL
jgi:peroxiredoxin Q/BCP